MTSLKFAWMKACGKPRLPDHLDQQICKPKKKGMGKLHVECTCGLGR